MHQGSAGIVLFMLVAGWSSAARAQNAAETAIILSGTGAAQAKSQKALGAAAGHALQRSAATMNNQRRTAATTFRRGATRSRGTTGDFALALPGDVDPLETTDAPGYDLGNGVKIRVSGRLRPVGNPVSTEPE